MQPGKASGTAYRVALRRAAHQLVDTPVVLHDPLALRILGLDADGKRSAAAGSRKNDAANDLRAPQRPWSISLRAFLVARSAFAEQTLAHAVANGTQQYVLLGAGLDTFAYRNPHPHLRVLEVDHPDSQAQKLLLLRASHIDVPASVAHIAVDFLHHSLADKLAAGGFDRTQPAVFAWLGVVPYLTDDAFTSTLHTLAACAPGSTLVMDYGLPRHALPHAEQLAFDSIAARVRAAGEPFQLFFDTHTLHARLRQAGFHVLHDLHRDAINARYFAHRRDNLRILGTAAHLLSAQLHADV